MLAEKISNFSYRLVSGVGSQFIGFTRSLFQRLNFILDPLINLLYRLRYQGKIKYEGIFSEVVENLFSPSVVFPLIFSVYIYMGFMSQVPFPFRRAFLTSLLVLASVIIAYFLGLDLSGIIDVDSPTGKDFSMNFAFGLFFLGSVGWISHYIMVGGLPIFQTYLRGRNIVWMISFILFSFGSTLMLGRWSYRFSEGTIGNKEFYKRFFVLLVFTFLLIVPNAYRVDLIIPLLTFVIILSSFEIVSNYKVIAWSIVLFLIMISQKIVYFFGQGRSSSISYLTLSRAGFTLYSLSRITKIAGLTGVRHGKFYLSVLEDIFFTALNIPRIRGEVIGSEVIGLPKALTTTFAGPFVLEFGILAPIIPAILLGLILGISYKALSKSGNNDKAVLAPLYGLMLSISLIWVESGPVRFYLIFIFLVSAIFVIRRVIH